MTDRLLVAWIATACVATVLVLEFKDAIAATLRSVLP